MKTITDFQDYEKELCKLKLYTLPYNPTEDVCRKGLIDRFIIGLSEKGWVIKSDKRYDGEGVSLLSGSNSGSNVSYSIPQFQSDYHLCYSAIPDFLIKNSFSGDFSLLEIKKLSEGLNQRKFQVIGATKLIQLYEAGKLTEEEIKGISDLCNYCGNKYKAKYDKYKESNDPSNDPNRYVYRRNADEIRNIANGMPDNKEEVNAAASKLYTLEVGPKYKSWDAGNLCTVIFKNGNSVELYQQDWYILDLYFVHNFKSVILINGECAKRWFIKNNGRLEKDSYDLTDEKDFNRFKEDFKNDLQ